MFNYLNPNEVIRFPAVEDRFSPNDRPKSDKLTVTVCAKYRDKCDRQQWRNTTPNCFDRCGGRRAVRCTECLWNRTQRIDTSQLSKSNNSTRAAVFFQRQKHPSHITALRRLI